MTPQPGEKPWALWVAMLYAAALAVMTLPMLVASFLGRLGDIDCPRLFLAWQYWAWLVVMGAAQWALLRVPVRVASKRPTTRGPVLVTILASGLMAGALVAAGIGSLYEFATRLEGAPDWIGWVGLGIVLLVWGAWSAVFARMTRTRDASDALSRQCRLLIRGSILELLVAVPTHVVARYRDYCCAGFMTFIGLTAGLSVMLFAFGPSIFFLFVERWKALHPVRSPR
ncbi:MAG TPA: hypothetical protein DCM86_03665 [Verrucomicrobiales bacterium]|nr:hypothetical protein [Verrucomicrobiales bacterium]